MSERGPGPDELAGVSAAVVERRGRPSIVWLIPMVARFPSRTRATMIVTT